MRARLYRGSRDLIAQRQAIERAFRPSARQLFPVLADVREASREVIGNDDQGAPVLGAPTYRNVGPERPRIGKAKRVKATQTARARARSRVREVRPGRPVEAQAEARVVPTPVLERSHTWRSRHNPAKARTEWRPTRIGVARYGIKDLGWQPAGTYLDRRGKLRKAAQS